MVKITMAIFCLIAFGFNAYAMTDAEYEVLKKTSQAFVAADAKLDQTWRSVMSELDDEEKAILRKEQRLWIKTGWDEDAARIMAQEHLSKGDAYAKAIENRIGKLLAKSKKQAQISTPAFMAKQSSNDSAAAATEGTNIPVQQKGTTISSKSTPDQAETLTVEAEGTGTTKMQALNAAWMEAVRKAVGIVMVGKQEAINDELTEQIVTHSRGQVNSYKVLEENKADGVWNITILANIDKDILQETVGTSRTSTMSFDGAAAAARKTTKEAKNASALEVVKEALALLKPEEWIECKSEVRKYTNKNGRDEFYISFLLYPNLKNYKIQSDQAEKLISKVATSSEDVKINIDSAKVALQIIKEPKFDNSAKPADRVNNYTGKPQVSPGFGELRAHKNAICFFKNVGNMRCYEFKGTDVESYIRRYYQTQPSYNINLSAESGDDFEGLLAQEKDEITYPVWSEYGGTNCIYIKPTVGRYVTSQYNIPLHLTDEQLVTIKEITGKCEITPKSKKN